MFNQLTVIKFYMAALFQVRIHRVVPTAVVGAGPQSVEVVLEAEEPWLLGAGRWAEVGVVIW